MLTKKNLQKANKYNKKSDCLFYIFVIELSTA